MAITPEEIKSRLSANYMAIRPTLTGANAVDDKRQQQIFTNLQKGYNTNQAQFTDRKAFESAYGYAEKPSGEKMILDTFYKTVNPEMTPPPNTPQTKEAARAAFGSLLNTAASLPKYVEPSSYVPVDKNVVKTNEIKNPDGGKTVSVQRSDGKIYNTEYFPNGAVKNTNITNAFPNQKVGQTSVNPVRTPNIRKAPTSVAPTTPTTTSTTPAPTTTTPTAPTTTTSTTAVPEFTYTPKGDTKKEEPKVTSFATTDKGILNANEESLQAAKYDQLLRMKNKDISNAETEYNKGLKVLQDTNTNIRALYGIDEKGNIDPNNKTSLAFTQQAALQDYKKVKDDLLSEYTGTRLNNVKAQMFQMLAQRNVTDVNKVSPELLLQLSGEVGAAAMNDIYQAKEKTVNDIEARKKEVQAKLDQLRENGMIKNNEFAVASETLRASTEKLKQSVEKQFSNDVFTLVDLKNTKAEARGTDVMNTLQKFAAQVGITGKGLAALNDYVGRYKNSADALTGMLADLSNPNSNIYRAIETAEQRAAMTAQLQQQQKLELAQAQKKGAADGTSMSWGLPARTYVASSFINAVKDGLKDAVSKSERKPLANQIAMDYYATQGQTPALGPDGFMDDQLVIAVPRDYAVNWVSDRL